MPWEIIGQIPGGIIGGYNTAIGNGAGYFWTTGRYNVAIGAFAFYDSDGGQGDNTAIGYVSMAGATVNVGENVGIGSGTFSGTTLGGLHDCTANTAVGAWAGVMVTNGSGNTLIGDRVASDWSTPSTALTSGSYNTFVGFGTGLNSSTQHNNSTAIGYMAKVDADNAVVLGQAGATPPVNVGIGTTTPQTPLDVTGDATIRGVLRVPAAGDVGMGAFTNGSNPTPGQ